MLLRFSCGECDMFSDIMIQPIELACSALSSFVTLGISTAKLTKKPLP